jgi:hypothetical protein
LIDPVDPIVRSIRLSDCLIDLMGLIDLADPIVRCDAGCMIVAMWYFRVLFANVAEW